jgi:diguanylate cyclase (GGDEF)-like protein
MELRMQAIPITARQTGGANHHAIRTQQGELGATLARMSAMLSLDPAALADEPALDNPEMVLRLALLAMNEAEKRIERQERRIAELENLSVTDELTGLLNRRGFRMQVRKAQALVKRGATRALLVMIDLDRFKSVNDTHGHAAGDAMLVAVAEILRNRVRETDTVARLGGDEFAILMMGTDLDEVEAKLALLAGDLNTRTLHWDGIEIPILASVGSEALDPALGVEAALDQADHAMYATKKTRNGQFAGR